MSTITLAGDYRSALTHFAQYGLASLAEQYHPQGVTLGWSREAVPKAQITVKGADVHTIAGYLHELAKQLSEPESWVMRDVIYGSGKDEKKFSPFSPRIRVIDPKKYPTDWRKHQKARHNNLDGLTANHDILNLRWISGLGEAAYWRFDRKDNRPDHGASRWEMKTRNKGEEFVQHRLRSMCVELTSWSAEKILSGLLGESLNDSLGKNKSDSRTSTGFTTPQPTDVALVFAALLGISVFPVIHQVHQLSVTPGAWPSDSLHPQKMVLPIATEHMTLARLRTILRSRAYVQALEQVCNPESEKYKSTAENVFDTAGSAEWFKARGIQAVVRFPIKLAGSDSAPERQVQVGKSVLL